MIILIDAYNLLKKIHGPTVSETERRAFVNLLGSYLKRRNHKVIVVFDAGPSLLFEAEKQKGVTVWYSGAHQTADDLIIAYAKEHRNKDIIVVTLDREIRIKVGESRIETIDPETFYAKVQEVCYPQRKSNRQDESDIVKLAEGSDFELDALMREAAGMKMPVKDEGSVAVRNSSSKQVSKKDRVFQKVLDKL